MGDDPLRPFRDLFGQSRQDEIDNLERMAGYIAIFFNTLRNQGMPESAATAITQTWIMSSLQQMKSEGNN